MFFSDKQLLNLPFCLTLVLGILRVDASYSAIFKFHNDSYVSFTYEVALVPFNGEFKIKNSSFDLDSDKPENSHIFLSIDLNNSSAGFLLATKGMLGKSVLYAEKYPEITFQSRSIIYKDEQFEVLGELMIRGVTKLVKLFVKPIGFEPSMVDIETSPQFHISTVIERNIFGADGYSGFVGNNIRLDTKVKLIRNF